MHSMLIEIRCPVSLGKSRLPSGRVVPTAVRSGTVLPRALPLPLAALYHTHLYWLLLVCYSLEPTVGYTRVITDMGLGG